MTTVVLIPGDGIGPEICAATQRVVDASGASIDWQRHDAGQTAVEQSGTPIPEPLLQAIETHRVALKGPVTTQVGRGFASVNVTLRKRFKLFANLRPVRSLPGLETKHGVIDLVVVRENTEDLYAGIEHEVTEGVVTSVKVITAKACDNIAEFAFAYARRHQRHTVTAVHKANIMKVADGLFLDCVRNRARDFYDIELGEMIVDNAAMQLVMNPQQFDVLVLPNLYGDIISDLCAGLVGGLGLCPGANLGREHAIFEAVHGSAPDIAGQGVANPTALMLAAEMMLRHLQQHAAADRLHAGLIEALSVPEQRTRDLPGGTAGTAEFAEHVIAAMEKLS